MDAKARLKARWRRRSRSYVNVDEIENTNKHATQKIKSSKRRRNYRQTVKELTGLDIAENATGFDEGGVKRSEKNSPG